MSYKLFPTPADKELTPTIANNLHSLLKLVFQTQKHEFPPELFDAIHTSVLTDLLTDENLPPGITRNAEDWFEAFGNTLPPALTQPTKAEMKWLNEEFEKAYAEWDKIAESDEAKVKIKQSIDIVSLEEQEFYLDHEEDDAINQGGI